MADKFTLDPPDADGLEPGTYTPVKIATSTVPELIGRFAIHRRPDPKPNSGQPPGRLVEGTDGALLVFEDEAAASAWLSRSLEKSGVGEAASRTLNAGAPEIEGGP